MRPSTLLFTTLLGFGACTPPGDTAGVDTQDPDTSGTDSGDTGTASPAWSAPARVALPFAVVGDPAPSATLTLAGDASTGGLELAVSGPFELLGELGPLDGGERLLTVRYTGDMASPALAVGGVTLTIDGDVLAVDLAAVVGAAGLGSATWASDAYGDHALVELPSAPNAAGTTPWSDDRVLLALPPGLTDRDGVDVVTHLHGHNAELSRTVAAQRLVEGLAYSGRDAVLLVPQGPVNAASGDFGQLAAPGGHQRLVRDALAVLYRDGYIGWPVAGAQVLSSHSGGYIATAKIVSDGGLPISAVHLYDSLYGYVSTYEAYASSGGRLRSLYTSGGGTDANNLAMAADLRASGLDVGASLTDDALAAEPLLVGFSAAAHGACLSDERTYARWLMWSGLPFRPGATPEVRAVVHSGATALVSWLPDGQAGALVRVEGSDDGQSWSTLAETAASFAEVALTRWVRIRLVDGAVVSGPSDVYGAATGAGPRWLVVDGFDRVFGGSYTAPSHDFAARVGGALGRPFDAASNEAVVAGEVVLSDYDAVLWLLGDESSADLTFDADERALIAAYVGAGGKIAVSGSEVGYATPSAWLQSALGATYVADDAGTTSLSDGFTFGVAYPEDYPDVLSGQRTLWTYGTGGAAAVVSGDARVVVGFPLETLAPGDLGPALAELVAAVGG